MWKSKKSVQQYAREIYHIYVKGFARSSMYYFSIIAAESAQVLMIKNIDLFLSQTFSPPGF